MLREDQMPALRPLPVSKRGERRRYRLLEDWGFCFLGPGFTYMIPQGFRFDGAISRRILCSILSSSGYLFLAGLFHDFPYKYGFAFRFSMVGSYDGKPRSIYKEYLTQKEADQKFEALADRINVGAHIFTRAAYISLRAFGCFAWEKHRKKDMECCIEPVGYTSFRRGQNQG